MLFENVSSSQGCFGASYLVYIDQNGQFDCTSWVFLSLNRSERSTYTSELFSACSSKCFKFKELFWRKILVKFKGCLGASFSGQVQSTILVRANWSSSTCRFWRKLFGQVQSFSGARVWRQLCGQVHRAVLAPAFRQVQTITFIFRGQERCQGTYTFLTPTGRLEEYHTPVFFYRVSCQRQARARPAV